MKNRSICSRLMLGSSVLITLVFLVAAASIYFRMKETLYGRMDEELEGSLTMLATEVEITGQKIHQEWVDIVDQDRLHGQDDYVQVWNVKTGSTRRSKTLGDDSLPQIRGGLGELVFESVSLPNGRQLRAVGSLFLPGLDEEGGPNVLVASENPQVMVVASELTGIDSALRSLLLTLGLGLIVALLLSILVIHFIIKKALLPIKKLELEVSLIDVNNPRDISESRDGFPTELLGLVTQYSNLLGRIAKVRLRERDFAANAAHELRTPLTGIQASLEQVLSREREVSDYQERVGETLAISIQMRRLVDRLMRFSRLQNGSEKVDLVEVNLHALVDARLCSLEDDLDGRGMTIQREFSDIDPVVLSDESLLTILVGNVLGNAASHGRPASLITLKTGQSDQGWMLEIENEMESDKTPDLERIFEPFYSGDVSHSRHSGIGLALSREIAGVLGIKLQADVREGSFFVIRLRFPA